MTSKWVDVLERAAWTLLQAGTGEAVVALLNLPPGLGAVVAAVLSAIKSRFAQKFGNGTGATVPVAKEGFFLRG